MVKTIDPPKFNNKRLQEILNPVLAQDAVNKDYVDNHTGNGSDYSPTFMSIDDIKYIDNSNFMIKKFHARKGDNSGNTGLLETTIVTAKDTAGINATWMSNVKTGTLSITNGSANVVGVGTSFLSLKVGTTIRVNGLYSRRVLTITDDTNLTVESAFANTLSGVSYVEGSLAINTIYLVYWLDSTVEKAGTVSGTAGSYTLTGTGTNWQGGGTNSINLGDFIEIQDDYGLYGQRTVYKVASRANDTTLTLETPLQTSPSGKKVYGAQGFLCVPSCYDMAMGDTMPAFHSEMANYGWTSARQLPFAIKTKKATTNMENFIYSAHSKEVLFTQVDTAAAVNRTAISPDSYRICSVDATSTSIPVDTTPFVPRSAKKLLTELDSGYCGGTAPAGMDWRTTGSTYWRILTVATGAYAGNWTRAVIPLDGTGSFDVRGTSYNTAGSYAYLDGFSF